MTRRSFFCLTLSMLALLAMGLVVGLSRPAWLYRLVPDSTGDANPDNVSVADGAVVIGTGEVDVTDGILMLVPLAAGQVVEVLVHDGQQVREGDPLVRLAADDAEAQLAQAEANFRMAELQVTSAEQEKQKHAAELDELSLTLKRASLQVELQEIEVSRLSEGRSLDVVSDRRLKAGQKQLKILQLAVDAESARLGTARAMDLGLPVQLAQAQLKSAQAARDLAARQVERCVLTAPKDGSVLRVAAQVGQTYSGISPEAAVWLRPERPWVVRCEIDQQYIDRIAVGMPCDIYDDGSDMLKSKGAVSSKGQWVTLHQSRPGRSLELREQRTVECLISITNPETLLIGQRVRVVIRSAQAPSHSTISSNAEQPISSE